MLRNFTILAALLIAYQVLRARLHPGKSTPVARTSSDSTRMVQCLSGETYVPVDETVFEDDAQFCCQQHRRDLAGNTRG